MTRIALDGTDRRILNSLQENARISNVKLAERVNMSQSQCLRRLRQLEDLGMIDRYVTLLNKEKLGFGVTAFVLVTLERRIANAGEKFARRIHLIPEVLECHGITASEDYLLKVVSKDIRSYSEFMTEQLRSCEAVSHTQTFLLLDCLKLETGLPLSP